MDNDKSNITSPITTVTNEGMGVWSTVEGGGGGGGGGGYDSYGWEEVTIGG